MYLNIKPAAAASCSTFLTVSGSITGLEIYSNYIGIANYIYEIDIMILQSMHNIYSTQLFF